MTTRAAVTTPSSRDVLLFDATDLVHVDAVGALHITGAGNRHFTHIFAPGTWTAVRAVNVVKRDGVLVVNGEQHDVIKPEKLVRKIKTS